MTRGTGSSTWEGRPTSFAADLVTASSTSRTSPRACALEWYRGNIDEPQGWREVEAAVAAAGPFDFAICSHTLEDVANPSLICRKLGRIARMGYVAVPSKYKELSRFEANPPTYRGYIHHRWIFTVRDDRFWGFPKLNFLDHDAYFDRFCAPENAADEQLSFWWKNGLELDVVNGGYLGPSPAHVADYYRQGLTGDDLDRRHPAGTAAGRRLPTRFRRSAGNPISAATWPSWRNA